MKRNFHQNSNLSQLRLSELHSISAPATEDLSLHFEARLGTSSLYLKIVQKLLRQQNNTRSQVKPVQPTVKDEAATIKAEIIAAKDVTSLVSLYLDYTEAIESNPELKNLLTNRKKALKTLNS